MKRVLLDQGLPFQTGTILRTRGWDVVHVREVGLSTAEDAAILEYAAKESRIAVTLDRDFPQIAAALASGIPSVILIRQQGLRAVGVADLLDRVWTAHEAALSDGCILTVGLRGTRVRSLPIR